MVVPLNPRDSWFGSSMVEHAAVNRVTDDRYLPEPYCFESLKVRQNNIFCVYSRTSIQHGSSITIKIFWDSSYGYILG